MNNETSPETKTESPRQRSLREHIAGTIDPDPGEERLYAMEVADRHYAEKQALREQLQSTSQQLTETQQKLTEAEKAAFIDGLTGCYNRNYWEDYIKNNPDPTKDNGQLIIFSADVNELKYANDALGYEAGDLLLQYAAGQLRRLFQRSDDIIIRLGGDEFIVLCHDHNASEASYQRIIETVSERLRLDREDPNTPSVDIGLGASLYQPPEEDGKNITNRGTRIEATKLQADNAMKYNKYLVANAVNGESPAISLPSDYYRAFVEDPDFAAYLERSRQAKDSTETEQLQA